MLYRIIVAAAVSMAGTAFVVPSSAMTMKECSSRYLAAGDAGTLKGGILHDFQRRECGAASADVSGSGQTLVAGAQDPKKPTAAAPDEVVFPRSIDKKFVNERPGMARMHTCLEQYRINKNNNALRGLKWMQKGGGYYSLCNARLKG